MTQRRAGASLAQDGGLDQSEAAIPVMILAGGRAVRLGGDKALAPFAGATLLDAVLGRLAGRIALNANGDPDRFTRFGLAVHPDPLPDFPGPLAGVLAAMIWATDAAYVATVPTDAPLLPLDLVSRLATALRCTRPDTIICAESGGRIHPVVALWPTRLREALCHALTEEKLFKVFDFAARYPVVRVAFAAADYDPFLNINTVADLTAAEALWDRLPKPRAAG